MQWTLAVVLVVVFSAALVGGGAFLKGDGGNRKVRNDANLKDSDVHHGMTGGVGNQIGRAHV